MALPLLLLDTNILLRIAEFDSQQDESLVVAVEHWKKTHTLCITIQNAIEFWNVVTRPQKNNGFGRSIAEAAAETDSLTRHFTLLLETREAFALWRKLVEDFNVKGTLVHDARLVAIMLEYEVTQILTLNVRDFTRFPFIRAINPREAS